MNWYEYKSRREKRIAPPWVFNSLVFPGAKARLKKLSSHWEAVFTPSASGLIKDSISFPHTQCQQMYMHLYSQISTVLGPN